MLEMNQMWNAGDNLLGFSDLFDDASSVDFSVESISLFSFLEKSIS